MNPFHRKPGNKPIAHTGNNIDIHKVLSDLHTLIGAGERYYEEYNNLKLEAAKLVVERERIQVMREEILAKYQNERDKILANLANRNLDRQFIQNLLTQAIQSNDKEIVSLGFDLYKNFLVNNTIV